MADGPLAGVQVLEFAGIGPVPFAAMVLADLGATVTVVDRTAESVINEPGRANSSALRRGRRSIALDLKQQPATEVVLELVRRSDVLIEGFRPGVMERLRLGPSDCVSINQRLIYARVTGWGQDGPLALRAGHDINYLSIAGLLGAIGSELNPPPPPLNIVGDNSGGALSTVVGVLSALIERDRSGFGQVIDAAMFDGIAYLMTHIFSMQAEGAWTDNRWSNSIDGGAPYYSTYETADGRFMSIGAGEQRFYRIALGALGLTDIDPITQRDQRTWPVLRRRITGAFLSKTQAQWCAIFEGLDACVEPVLRLAEVSGHPHVAARKGFIEWEGMEAPGPAPAPRFSRSRSGALGRPPTSGEDTVVILGELGYDREAINGLLDQRVAEQS
jgi:alpha-methylacyl-CoA racemase